MSSKPIQVFEFQKLKIGQNGFNSDHFKALVQFNENNDNKYFTPVYQGILFNSYVGVIQIGGLTIEILPKADNSNNKSLWRDVLLHMLKECRYLQVDNVSETNLKRRYNSILDVYFEIYLKELEYLIKRGITPKKSLTLDLKVKCNWDIVRGLFDSDGNISKNGFKITSGSIKLISYLEDFFNTEGFKTSIIKKGNAMDIYIRSNQKPLKDTLKSIRSKLYNNSKYYLKRKKDQIDALCSDT